MLRLISSINIEQRATKDFPSRDKKYSFAFLNAFSGTDTWEDLTNTGSIVFPKNIYFKDENGNSVSMFGKNLTSGQNTVPILLRGDKVTVYCGYMYDTEHGEKTELNKVFEGFISKIINKLPITLELEDNMWSLKQIQTPNKLFKAKDYTLQTMVQELLKGTDFTVRTDISTSVGDFRTQNETVAQVLERIQKDYKIESFFTGNVLTVSGIVYYPDDRNDVIFEFQRNIISDELEYRRKDDVKIGVKAYSINESELSETTKDGKPKTKKTRLEVSVGPTDGEVRTLYFWNIKSEADLKKQAEARLNRISYEGFYGSFLTFGLPFVKQGDAVIIRDSVLPERKGTYLVKKVLYDFSFDGGYRQKIYIDIRIDVLSDSDLLAGL